MYYVTMQITFLTRKFRNGERNLHCDVVHITTKWVSSLALDCNGVFAIKAYEAYSTISYYTNVICLQPLCVLNIFNFLNKFRQLYSSDLFI